MKHAFLAMALLVLFANACDDNSNNNNNNNTGTVTPDATEWTYRLQQSSDDFTLWTTPSTHRITSAERAPDATSSGITISAAKNEYEPFQMIVDPGAPEFTVSVSPLDSLGSGASLTISRVDFSQGRADPLSPLSDGETVASSGSTPTVLWFTIYIPPTAPAGDHTVTVTLTAGGTTLAVPVNITVFDFSLPPAATFSTQLNVSVSGLIPPGGTEEDAKNMLFAHRMTPKSVTWPSGFNWNITWDNSNSTDVCNLFWDEPEESPPYSIGSLAHKYILGEGWNGTGFPTAMLFQFVDNATPRPAEFCGISRGDHYGSPEYNAEWSQWLSALEGYLTTNGMEHKGYYYVQNEPQNEEDHNLAAHLCQLTRAAAPNLRIAISEEPKPEIAEVNGCGYDIWIAHIRSYQEEYAHQRQQTHEEEVWFYSLDHDPDPFFNPTSADNDGIHQRIIPWVSWHYRVTGWAYYDFGRFFNGHLPSIRVELFREGFEDYEYLYLANGGAHPSVGTTSDIDETVNSVASSLTSWTKNPDALMTLRRELGKYIEGSRDTVPILEVASDIRPKGEYHISFQDPQGPPAAEPLMVDDATWIKIGWMPYDNDLGYGWYGENIDNPSIALYGYDDAAGYTEIERSYIYDDYGRANLFEFAIANGTYEVTLSVGRPGRAYGGDPHNAVVEGVVFVDDEPTTDTERVFTRTMEVTVSDGSLSLEVGGRSETTGDFAYTFLSSLSIVPID